METKQIFNEEEEIEKILERFPGIKALLLLDVIEINSSQKIVEI